MQLQTTLISPATEMAIVNFFTNRDISSNDSHELTNEIYFDRWKLAVAALEQEYTTLPKSLFFYWCYQNIKASDDCGDCWLFPNGFEFDEQGRKSVCLTQNNCACHTRTLVKVKLYIPSPQPLYAKLGIE